MGAEFTFYDFLDGNGANIVHVWLGNIPKGAKAKFNKWLRHLEATPPGLWKRPLVETLDGYCAGLFEVRVSLSTQQFRILGAHRADRTPTLLHCFIKPGEDVPHADCDEANSRKAALQNDPKRRVKHDYK